MTARRARGSVLLGLGVPAEPSILLCPGPVKLTQRVREAMQQSDIGHRTPAAIRQLARARENIRSVYELDGFDVVVLPGSGTTALEAIASSSVPEGVSLVLTNGRFGERLADIARANRSAVEVLSFGWNQPFELPAVERLLESGAVGQVLFVHHETSTGRLNPLRQVVELAERHDVETVVDMVSSFGAESLDATGALPTWIATSANKCLEAPPGLGIVLGHRQSFRSLTSTPGLFTLNLRAQHHAQAVIGVPLTTPPVHLVAALAVAAGRAADETPRVRGERYRAHAVRIRTALTEQGLTAIVDPLHASRSVTVFRLPDHIPASAVIELLYGDGIVAYPSDPRNGNSITIATMGQLTSDDIDESIEALERTLLDASRPAAAV